MTLSLIIYCKNYYTLMPDFCKRFLLKAIKPYVAKAT